jgi:CRP/FNR family cyclic AMP-dependent transcriptional regulator
VERTPAPYGLTIVDSCLNCSTREACIFHGLSPELLRKVDSCRETSLYPPGAVLFVEGEPARGLFVVCGGLTKLTVNSKGGRRISVRFLEPGGGMGLSSMLLNQPHQVSAETFAPSQICFFPRAEFLPLVQSQGAISLRMAEYLGSELHQAWFHLRMVGLAPTARAKLAMLLCEYAIHHGQATAKGFRVIRNVTEEGIGETLGVSRETICRLLTEFERRKLIRMKGATLLILNTENLRALSEG